MSCKYIQRQQFTFFAKSMLRTLIPIFRDSNNIPMIQTTENFPSGHLIMDAFVKQDT